MTDLFAAALWGAQDISSVCQCMFFELSEGKTKAAASHFAETLHHEPQGHTMKRLCFMAVSEQGNM